MLSAIARCRSAALGAHRLRCDDCDHEPPLVYNSCLDRHCPKCQVHTRKRWLEARHKELLPVRYLHVVFTLPRVLSQLALQNKDAIYSLLLRASAQTLLEVARDPRHLGAEIGFLSILPTWNQRLQEHAHVHTVVPAGGLALDHSRWIDAPSNSFLPKPASNRRRQAASGRQRRESPAGGLDMSQYLSLRPRDSIIARDGRPFGVGQGQRMRPLKWLLPTVLAGSLRTLVGREMNLDFNEPDLREALNRPQSPVLPVERWSSLFPQPAGYCGERRCPEPRTPSLPDSARAVQTRWRRGGPARQSS